MEIDGKGTLRILLRDGEYKMAFEHMEMDIVVKLLDALRGYRLSFYHLDDHRLDMYVVSNRMRVPLSKLLLSPQGNFRVLLGSFSEDEIRKVLAIRDTLIHQSKALDDKYAKLMESGIGLNLLLSRIVSIGVLMALLEIQRLIACLRYGVEGTKINFQNLRRSEVVLVNAFGEGILWYMLAVCLKTP